MTTQRWWLAASLAGAWALAGGAAHAADAGTPSALPDPSAAVTDGGSTSSNGGPTESDAGASPPTSASTPLVSDEGREALAAILSEPVLSTASQTSEAASDAPGTSVVITGDDIRRHGFATVEEAIRYLAPGMFVSDHIHLGEIGARGVGIPGNRNAHVLVLIDGQVVTESSVGAQPLNQILGMPLEMIEQIEVVVGPGSVLYGPNAMFGVIHIFTRTGGDFRGLHAAAETEAGAGYRLMLGGGSAFSLGGISGDVAAGVELYRRRQPVTLDNQTVVLATPFGEVRPRFRHDGPADGVWGGVWNNNSREETAGHLRLRLGSVDALARAGGSWTNDPFMTPDFDEPWQGEVYDWADVGVRIKETVTPRLDLGLRLYGDYRRFVRRSASSDPGVCEGNPPEGCKTEVDISEYWSGAEAQATVDWFENRSNVTLLGVDGRLTIYDRVTSFTNWDGSPSIPAVSDNEPHYKWLGVYGQHTAKLTGRLTLNAGARFDTDSRRASAFSPRLALIASLWRGATVKAIYSSAFRPPSYVETHLGHPFGIVRARDLDNEVTRSGELAFEQRWGALRAYANGYLQTWRQLIAFVPLTEAQRQQAIMDGTLSPFSPVAQQYRNAGTIRNVGADIGIEGNSQPGAARVLRWGLGVTVTHARQTLAGSATARLRGMPEMYGSGRISYELGGHLPTLSLAAFAAPRYPVTGVQPGAYPVDPMGPRTLTGVAALTGAVPVLRGLSYRLSAHVSAEDRTGATIGPVVTPTALNPSPGLMPVERLRLFFGLRYRFGQ